MEPKVRVIGDVTHVKACVSSCIDKHAPIIIANPRAAVGAISGCVQRCIKPKPNPLELAACAKAQRECMAEVKEGVDAAAKGCNVKRDECINAIVSP